MLKTYEKFIIKNFINKFLLISLIFFGLVIILSVLEEISFLKMMKLIFLYPYFLTLLGAPITLFEIFPFVFLLSTQFLFYDLFKKRRIKSFESKWSEQFKNNQNFIFYVFFNRNIVSYYFL